MLYLIGLGQNDKDVTMHSIDIMKKCTVYAEFYTGFWNGSLQRIERKINKKIKLIPREMVESEFLVQEAKKNDVALLTTGDPLTATTHLQLLIDAKAHNVTTKIIHNTSIFTVVAETGLQIYKFGRTVTIPFPQKGYEPTSPYDMIAENKKSGLHTLVLLDVTDKPMTVRQALETLLKIESKKKMHIITEKHNILACCSLGTEKQKIIYDTVENIIKKDPKNVPAALVIPGEINFKEQEFLDML